MLTRCVLTESKSEPLSSLSPLSESIKTWLLRFTGLTMIIRGLGTLQNPNKPMNGVHSLESKCQNVLERCRHPNSQPSHRFCRKKISHTCRHVGIFVGITAWGPRLSFDAVCRKFIALKDETQSIKRFFCFTHSCINWIS